MFCFLSSTIRSRNWLPVKAIDLLSSIFEWLYLVLDKAG